MKRDWKWLVVGTVISWSFGFLGADRIYKGEIGVGILKLITLGGLGIWWLVDALIWTRELGQADTNK
jgi:TM2 domain-containing membrane protein YozV